MKHLFSFTAILLMLSLTACKEDISEADMNVKYDLSLGLPIGTAQFGLADLLAKFSDDDLRLTDDNHYKYVLESEGAFAFRDVTMLADGASVSAGDNYTFASKLPSAITASLPKDISTIETLFPAFTKQVKLGEKKFIEFSLNTKTDEERIDSAGIVHSELNIRLIKNGNVGVKVNKFKITFPMRDDTTGETLFIEQDNMDFDQQYDYSLDNFMVNIVKDPSNPSSKGGFVFEVEIDAEFTDGQLTATDAIGYEVTFTIFKHKVVYGFFKPTVLAKTKVTQSFNLLRDLNNGVSKGVLLFEDVQATLSLRNYDIGVKLELMLDSMRGYQRDSIQKGYKYAWFDNGSNKSLAISFAGRPLVPFTGKPSEKVQILNKDNGQIEQFFQKNFLTDMFEFYFSIGSNLDASGHPMFITGDAKVECDVSFEIPLRLRPGSYYVYQDTIRFDKGFLNNEVLNYLEEAQLGVKFKNSLPLGIDFSMTLYDKDNKKIDSALNKLAHTIKNANVNSAGEVVETAGEVHVVEDDWRIFLNNQTIKDLQNAEYIVYTANAGQLDGTKNIWFKDGNKFAVQMNIYAKGGIQKDLGGIK